MFGQGGGRSRQDERDDEIYAKAGRRMLDGGGNFISNWAQLEFQKSLDRHSAAMERLAAVLEKSALEQKEPQKLCTSPTGCHCVTASLDRDCEWWR